VVLTAIYAIWLRLRGAIVWQARLQFLIDAILITWLVRGTGDLVSPYITLYIFLISVSGFYLRKMEVHLVAAVCGLAFASFGILTTQSLIISTSGEVVPSRAFQVIAVNIGAFLLVGLLAGRLADRRMLGAELQKAEADFADLNILHERILSSINSGLITTDLQGKIRAFNRAAEQITRRDADETVGQSVFTVFGDEIRGPIELSLNGVQDVGFAPPNFEAVINSNGSGKSVAVACSVSPLIGRSGGINGLIIAFQDRSEVHAMEADLRKADRLSAVGRMAAGLAHEIRNPLGSISSAVQYLSEKGADARDGTALMDVVVRESDRLNKIISDFLAYARPQSETISRKLQEVDLGQAIGDCLALLRHDPAVREKHVFSFAKPESAVVINADESRVKQVIWNLLQNSVHAMPDGGTLSVVVDEPNANFARIVFADEGCGIDHATLENIYEPFQPGAHGTGLGLSIVHRIVTEGGGRIDVESEKGAGTRITIELPKQYAEAIDS
jgi:two-component system sensor histidine kinase PilS (NtrC family)